VVTDSEGAAIMTGTATDVPMAGRAATGASFPVLETRAGRHCRRLWLRIGPGAWICGDRGALSALPPSAARIGAITDGEILPWPYVFTAGDRTRAYRTLSAALVQSDDPETYEHWEANWGFAIDAQFLQGGERLLRTRSGHYVHRRDVYRATPTSFAGGSFRELAGGEPGVPFGWVAEDGARVHPRPAEEGPGEPLPRLSRVRVYALHGEGPGAFARIGPGRWVRARKLRWIAPAPPPAQVRVAARERWIDVDLSSQTLIAYEGAEPVFATLVSTGGPRFPTQPGVFRIWGRYIAHTMDNTESTHLRSHYRFADVPWVQFFDGDRGLHSVYWHDHFGLARSHGCVNLSPRDARWLFDFTTHPLPAGWVARTIPAGEGTVVRVRGVYSYEA
jgi:hypothetical protein